MASLDQYNSILGEKNAKHLLRRATFVYNRTLINQFSNLTPNQALDLLLQEIQLNLNLPYDPLPSGNADGFWTESNNLHTSFTNQERKASIVSGWWWYNAINCPNLKFKMCHFLSTRFTVEKGNGAGTSTDFYDHLKLLLYYSFGNYKTLSKKMCLNNCMLNYLNNTNNVKSAPNENYAREFIELFTIGKGEQIAPGNYTNYTENDIVQAAKVLTGFKCDFNRNTIDIDNGIPKGINVFADHNTENKVFSNAFNNQTINGAANEEQMSNELDDFVEMIFTQQSTAKHICRKLYAYFVKSTITAEVENDIINPLALELYTNNYELVPTVRRLLSSLHFYDRDDSNPEDETIGAIVKSPLQQLSEICSFLYASIPNPNTNPFDFYMVFWNDFLHNSFFKKANMIPFDPDNVAGYSAYHQIPDYDKNWISGSTLIARFKLAESLMDGKNRIDGSATDTAGKINITDALIQNDIISVVDDPYILTSELCAAFFGQEADEDRINYFMNTFLLQGQPPSDWTSVWSFFIVANFNAVVEIRLNSLITSILKAPESQLG